MKKICSIAFFLPFVFLSLFFFPMQAYSQGKAALIRDASIELDVVDTPIWKVINVMEKGGISNRKWIQIEVSFSTGISNKTGESMDDVSAEYEILFPTEDPKQPYVLLSGKVTYWAFALDGGKHHLLAFVPPRIIEKWGGSSKKINKTDVSKMDARVVFKFNDADIGIGYQVPRGGNINQVVDKFNKAKTLPGLAREKSGILGSDKTPWAFLNYDYYEAVKMGESSK